MAENHPPYLRAKHDGFIHCYTEALAKRTDEFEPVYSLPGKPAPPAAPVPAPAHEPVVATTDATETTAPQPPPAAEGETSDFVLGDDSPQAPAPAANDAPPTQPPAELEIPSDDTIGTLARPDLVRLARRMGLKFAMGTTRDEVLKAVLEAKHAKG